MKKAFTLFAIWMSLSLGAFASTAGGSWTLTLTDVPESQVFAEELPALTVEEFLNLTPKRYEDLTGQKLGVKKALQLKAAQRMVKQQIKKPADLIDKELYILLAIVGLGFIGMGLNSDWSGNEWIIALVLAIFCVIPGIIYALVKMKNYY